MHLSYHLRFLFELLSSGTVERLCRKIAAAGIPYGFGGIARLEQGLLPAERVVVEHYRLGSSAAILSRSFAQPGGDDTLGEFAQTMTREVARLREYEKFAAAMSPAEYECNRREVCRLVAQIADSMGERA